MENGRIIQIGTPDQRLRDRDHLALSPGQFGELWPGKVFDLQSGKRRIHGEQFRPGDPQSPPALLQCQHDAFIDRQCRFLTGVLGHVAQILGACGTECDPPCARELSGDAPEQRRFAGRILFHQRGEAAARDLRSRKIRELRAAAIARFDPGPVAGLPHTTDARRSSSRRGPRCLAYVPAMNQERVLVLRRTSTAAAAKTPAEQTASRRGSRSATRRTPLFQISEGPDGLIGSVTANLNRYDHESHRTSASRLVYIRETCVCERTMRRLFGSPLVSIILAVTLAIATVAMGPMHGAATASDVRKAYLTVGGAAPQFCGDSAPGRVAKADCAFCLSACGSVLPDVADIVLVVPRFLTASVTARAENLTVRHVMDSARSQRGPPVLV